MLCRYLFTCLIVYWESIQLGVFSEKRHDFNFSFQRSSYDTLSDLSSLPAQCVCLKLLWKPLLRHESCGYKFPCLSERRHSTATFHIYRETLSTNNRHYGGRAEKLATDPCHWDFIWTTGEALVPARSGSDRRGPTDEAGPPGAKTESLLSLQRCSCVRQHHPKGPLAQEPADHPSRWAAASHFELIRMLWSHICSACLMIVVDSPKAWCYLKLNVIVSSFQRTSSWRT